MQMEQQIDLYSLGEYLHEENKIIEKIHLKADSRCFVLEAIASKLFSKKWFRRLVQIGCQKHDNYQLSPILRYIQSQI